MQERNYKTILYFISSVILITLAIQVYWNYKNYQAGKQQLINDVQTSLDNAVSIYYENIAAQNTMGFLSSTINADVFKDFIYNTDKHNYSGTTSIIIQDSFPSGNRISIQGSRRTKADSIDKSFFRKRYPLDSLRNKNTYTFIGTDKQDSDTLYRRWENNTRFEVSPILGTLPIQDSLRLNALQDLTTQIVLSFGNDKIDFKIIDSLFTNELDRKNIDTKHNLSFQNCAIENCVIDKKQPLTNDLIVTSKSLLLPENGVLKAGVQNIAGVVLKRNLLGVLLSILLLSAVIGSLLYLLHIIQQQKQLAEIKNDFISNMTHEFKTPIATIGVAMESIQHFNTSNDAEKTKKYVEMSSQQVGKLNEMVEKLLETATINSEALALNKQETNIVELLESIQQKYIATQPEKEIVFDSKDDNIWIPLDAFHIENALDNIVDNAIKYGGNTIRITVEKLKSNIQISISDSGNGLTKAQISQIFEKFYRVPKGNTHDVKGFGIGLYYTKVIVEKHEGSITVDTQPTNFKILLPYV